MSDRRTSSGKTRPCYAWGATHYADRKVKSARHTRCCRKPEPTCGGAFVCATCGKLVGWCHGAHDDFPDDCDWCANIKWAEKDRRKFG